MHRVWGLYRSSVGKKIVMAVSGVLLVGFVLAHMLGNLKIYQGAEKFDAYAHFLRDFGYPAFGHGQFLWIARIGLLAAVGIHVTAAIQLTLMSRKARSHGYRRQENLSFTYASRTMRWGGMIITAFVIYHLLHLTVGSAHPSFEAGSVYRNVVTGFQSWPVSVAYMLSMLVLGLHLYHGLWSMTQTLSLDNPRVKRARRPIAALIAIVVVAGNISIPVSVLTGIVS